MAAEPRPWFTRHPALALLAVNAGVFVTLLLLAEIALRITIPFNPGYYMSVKGERGELVFPYGTIYMNSDGFSDKEFDLSNPHRIGHIGDSVTFGTGAGYGYRVSELLEEAYPEYEHMNFGGLDLSANASSIKYFAKLARKYELEKAIYLFNLNDILPDQAVTGAEKTTVTYGIDFLREYVDWLRGKSYVYTYLRNVVKSALAVSGTGWRGYPTYELAPHAHREVLEQTARRVGLLAKKMDELGVELVVVLLPYEMQISDEAAAKYAELGVHWEEGFLEESTQRMLIEMIDPDVRVLDAYQALVDPAAPEASKSSNGLGQYFVYDKGDKLDWNHPNREGHRRIAEFLIREQVFGPPTGSTTLGADASRTASAEAGAGS